MTLITGEWDEARIVDELKDKYGIRIYITKNIFNLV